MFAATLDERDASRAASVIQKLAIRECQIALTGGVAMEMLLRSNGRPSVRRPLNDLDFVVEDFATIPPLLANDFVLHHVHPFAPEGKLLLQLIDADHAVRIDLFRAFGETMRRSRELPGNTKPLRVVAVEDLVARTTQHVCAALGRGRPLDAKVGSAFRRLLGLGHRRLLEEAWRDHRQDVQLSFSDAMREASQLLELHPDLLVREKYSSVVTPCPQCQNYGPFRQSPPELIVRILGYW